jgi:hypothetical protein
MNLGRHFGVLWRFKFVVLAGMVLGLALAVLAAFHVPAMERRGSEQWQAQSDILVTQQGFPWGRVTLPDQSMTPAAAEALKESGQPVPDRSPTKNSLPFADPGRFSQLALLYSLIAHSDQVRASLPQNPEREQIQAYAVDATGNGTNFLPVIRITTTATSAPGAVELNSAAFGAFQALLKKEQAGSKIPTNDRVVLSVLNQPDHPLLLSGRSKTPSVLAFLLCIIGAIAVAHLLESLRPRVGRDDDDEQAPRQPSLVEHPPVLAPRPAAGSWSSAPGGGSALAGQRRKS